MTRAKEILIQSMIKLFDRRSVESPEIMHQEKINEQIIQQIEKIATMAKISKKVFEIFSFFFNNFSDIKKRNHKTLSFITIMSSSCEPNS